MFDILTLKPPKDVPFNSDLSNTITTYNYGSIKNLAMQVTKLIIAILG